jgi:hypothetical protein
VYLLTKIPQQAGVYLLTKIPWQEGGHLLTGPLGKQVQKPVNCASRRWEQDKLLFYSLSYSVLRKQELVLGNSGLSTAEFCL